MQGERSTTELIRPRKYLIKNPIYFQLFSEINNLNLTLALTLTLTLHCIIVYALARRRV